MSAGVTGTGDEPNEAGVLGEAALGVGVHGVSHGAAVAGVLGVNDNATDQAGVGVHGRSAATGVFGESSTWHGVVGHATSAARGEGVHGEGPVGVAGVGRTWVGVYGETRGAENGPAGVWGEGGAGGTGVKGHARAVGAAGVAGYHLATEGDGGPGLLGNSVRGRGVQGDGVVGVAGFGSGWIGVYGETNAPVEVGAAGVWGDGKTTGDGVKGVAHGAGKAAVCGFQLGNNGPGVYGKGSPAGQFDGDVVVTGELKLPGAADFAEEFDVGAAGVVAGCCVVLDEAGAVIPCDSDYDPRAAGVVSGAGGLRPGIVLDRQFASDRATLALIGKAWVLADADRAPIRVGDMMTTSSRPGHAMRASDTSRAFGSVIGKALTPLASGTGLVKVLVHLR